MINSSPFKRVFAFFVACVLSTTLSAADTYTSNGYAQNYYDPCFQPCEPCPDYCDPCGFSCGGFEVGADFIFWQSCFNNLDYAILFDSDPNASGDVAASGNYQYLSHDFEPGFRVRAKKLDLFCRWDVSGSYTYYWSKAKNSVSPVDPQTLFSTLNHGGINIGENSLIEASHNVRYQSFDVLFHYELNCCGPCQTLTPFWGIEGIKLEQDLFSNTTGTSSGSDADFSLNWDSELLALGIKLGTDYEYDLMCGLGLFTRASVTVLAGQNETTNTQIRTVQPTPTVTNIAFETREDVCVPGFHLTVGLTYEKQCGCFNLKARVGYEFLDWWNIPQIRRFVAAGEDIGISTGSSGSNVGFHGLFAGVDVGY